MDERPQDIVARGYDRGADAFAGGYEPDVTLRLVHEAGLTVVRHDLETIDEPEGPATFLWVLARANSGEAAGRT